MNEATYLGRNITQVKAHNLKAILLSLLQNERVYRVELAEKTSLSTTTITNLIDELLAQGIVIEDGPEQTDRRRRVGRPRSALHLQKDARFAVGVHIGFGMFRVALVNLRAEVLDNRMVDFTIGESAEEVMKAITNMINTLIKENKVERTRVIGVGVGVPGLVDHRSGINIYSQNLKWEDVPIQAMLEDRLDFPVVVDNNVRTMALGEAFFGQGRSVDSLIFVYGRIGVGAGIVVDNKVYRGSGLGAGEIGHMVILAENGKQCRCGKKGCLETLVSVPFMIEKAQAVCQQKPQGLLCQHLSKTEGSLIDSVFLAARDGDDDANEIIKQSAAYLGMALANLVNLLNPELIVLGGIYAQEADLFIPEAASEMRQGSFGKLGDKVKVQPTPFVWKAGMIGAAAMALMSFFYMEFEDI